MRFETQAHIVGGPIAVRVAQVRLDAPAYALKILRTLRVWQHGGEAAGESREPAHNVARQGRGPRDERDVGYGETCGDQSRTVIFNRRKVPRVSSLTIIAPPIEFTYERGLDGLHAIVAAEFRDEATLRAERARHSPDHRIRILHPMQGSIAEHRVENALEVQLIGVPHRDI